MANRKNDPGIFLQLLSNALNSQGNARLFWFGLLVIAVLGIAIWSNWQKSPEPNPIPPSLNQQQPGHGGTPGGPIQVYFTRPGHPPDEPDNIAQALINYINQTQKTIDVCAHELDNKRITKALVDATNRGVRVRAVTESDYIEEDGIKQLQAAGVTLVEDKRDGALMHNKFMIFDNKAVWTGSMNFTENCAYRNDNHGLYIESPDLAENYATKFTWMFDRRKFGGLPERSARIPHPVVTLRDGTRIENYFSTHDKIANKLTIKIQETRKQIHFLAFSFTHPNMTEAMKLRAQAGVSIQGVFEKSQSLNTFSAYGKMSGLPNVEVYLDANPRNMHHKVLLLDSTITVAGSFNFSKSADEDNDENIVIIHSPSVTALFEEEFQRVYQLAKQGSGN